MNKSNGVKGWFIHRTAWMQSPKKRSKMPGQEGMLALMLQDEFVIILSPQAEEDFAGILQYTLETWEIGRSMFIDLS